MGINGENYGRNPDNSYVLEQLSIGGLWQANLTVRSTVDMQVGFLGVDLITNIKVLPAFPSKARHVL